MRRKPSLSSIPDKANRILNLILIAISLIMLRVWHLSVIQYDSKVEEAARPRKRVVIVPANRATIRDRFNEPLALNKVKYQAAVTYTDIKEIPSVAWERDERGRKIKRNKRRDYIRSLSEVLGYELGLSADRIEDLIHSKAVFYNNIPFVVKEDISESEYYRLKMLQRDWPGISPRRVPKRYYPKGRVAAEIIGTMGSINRSEYESIIEEMQTLKRVVQLHEEGEEEPFPEGFESIVQIKKRLRDLEEHAYSINDYVGKSGIEGRFEDELRGYYGRKVYYSDARGNYLHELPGARSPISGNRLLLSISAELQQYAEELLIRHEGLRQEQTKPGDLRDSGVSIPWIRGGAIVAMDPKTGEVLALAGYPRFDPNDFIASGDPDDDLAKRRRIQRWYEGESYIGAVWDQHVLLEREVYDPDLKHSAEEGVVLTWERYLDFILPPDHEVRVGLHNIRDLSGAVGFQQNLEALLSLSEQPNVLALLDALYTGEGHVPYSREWPPETLEAIERSLDRYPTETFVALRELEPYFAGVEQNYNKAFLIDLCRIVVQHDYFNEDLLAVVGRQSFPCYRNLSAASSVLSAEVKRMSASIFRESEFKRWREENQKSFLKQKRKEEEKQGRYAKPYLDYLDGVEKEQFTLFWERSRTDLLYSLLTGKPSGKQQLAPYEATLIAWHDEIARGAHQGLPWFAHYLLLKEQVEVMARTSAMSYLSSMRSFEELDRPLVNRYRNLRSAQGRLLEKHLAAAFYPRYGFGYARSYAFRQAIPQGSIFKLVTAYETLVQRYYRGIGIAELNPFTIVDEVRRAGNSWKIGYFSNGRPIPRIYKGGRVPKSLSRNIGRIDLVGALEKSSNPYFALCAGDCLEKPTDLVEAAKLFSYGSKTGIDLPGEISGFLPDDLETNRTNLYATSIGQGTLIVSPLQTAVMLSTFANCGDVLKPKIVRLGVGGRANFWTRKTERFDYQEALSFIGVDFPLFAYLWEEEESGVVHPVPTEIVREIDFPGPVRSILYKGMKRVVDSTPPYRFSALYHNQPEAIEAFKAMQGGMMGKTSSSECMERWHFDRKTGVRKTTQAWFGAIAAPEDSEDPDIVVVVFLRFAGGGKEAMPVAAQIIEKWRAIQKNNKLL